MAKLKANIHCGLQSVMPNAVIRVVPNKPIVTVEVSMIRRFLAIALFAVATVSSQTPPSLPSSFQAKTVHSPDGADIFVRWGGSGPVAVLIHGYAENSDSWAPLAADLMKDHTVVVPDLRGIGRSSKTADGYDKKTQAKDIFSISNSRGDRSIGRPALIARYFLKSSSTSPNLYLSTVRMPFVARRSCARTRARSSLMLNGL